jgi:WD40 repeat protein
LEVQVVASKPALPLEPISGRLERELMHPNNAGHLTGLRFSPDGRRLLAGDYPGGTVVVWDVATGRPLTTIETGRGYRGSAQYAFLSPDWQTLFVSKEERSTEQIEQDGKKLIRWQFNGGVRAWDLATGRLKTTYQHDPPRNVLGMQLSPDGSRFAAFEELPGIYERAKRAASLWDVKTGQYRPLPDGLESLGVFSPDSRTLAISAVDENGYAQAVKLFDGATGQEKLSVPIAEKNANAHVVAFSPDGRLMVVDCRAYKEAKKWDAWQCSLKWLDAATGKEVASIAGEPNDSFYNARFSPDGQTLAVTNWRGEHRKLLLFNVADQRLAKTLVLGKKGQDENLFASEPAFSPDGKLLAIITQVIPTNSGGRDQDARDVPQPRIHLIDVPAGAIRETLIAPPSFGRVACFSPDGRTLATGGHGKVLLWNLSEPRTK